MQMNPDKPLMSGQNLTKSFGERVLHKSLTFKINDGDRVGIIGNNGCGKSTFMRMIAGEDTEFDGLLVSQEGLEIGYVPQEPWLDPELTVIENIDAGLEKIRGLLARYDEVGEAFGEDDADFDALIAEQESLQEEIEIHDAWELDRHIEVAMEALGCPPRDALTANLSGGEKRRVALCRVLMQHPHLLLLDEPTNHLDSETIVWLEGYLNEYRGAYVLITHDRYFLDRVANSMWELTRGYGYGYKGNYTAYLEAKADQQRSAKKTDQRLLKRYERELAWSRTTPKARAVKNRARLKAFDDLQRQVEERVQESSVDLFIPTGPPLSPLVIRVENLSKRYGEKQLFEDLSFELPRGGIVGVTGPNGAGKTTLMKMLMGQVEPDRGEVKLGKNTTFCHVDQGRDTLNADLTVFEEVSGGVDWIKVGKETVHIRSYLARFNFSGAIQQTKVGKLSGGERNRLQLAKLLRGGGNVIILDEPTNDLDLETLHILEEALVQFPGCAIVITHDRYFLNRIATHILYFRGNGKVDWIQGDYDTYKTWRKAREADGDIDREGKKGKRVKMVR
ncbi:MAG: energy-dependent translational throttle protein EttA [Planctomycetota bacterium]|jgi:ATP-binding cassette ChvD family protein